MTRHPDAGPDTRDAMTKSVSSCKTVAESSGRSLTFALLLRVFLPFAGGYFLSCLFLRVVNAGIAPDLANMIRPVIRPPFSWCRASRYWAWRSFSSLCC